MRKTTTPVAPPTLEIVYHEIRFADPAQPIFGGQPHIQRDRPITYLHYHDCLELGLCLSGHGIFMIGHKVLPFHAGDVTWISPREVHLAQSAAGTESVWHWVYLDHGTLLAPPVATPELLDLRHLQGEGFGNVFGPERWPAAAPTVRALVGELRRQQPGWPTAVRGHLLQLLVGVQRLCPPLAELPRPPSNAALARLAPALQFLATHYAAPMDLGRLAARCGVSPVTLRRLFLATMGRPPRDYWLKVRLEMAAAMLRTQPEPIAAVAEAVGFETLSSFNRLFRQRYGVAPRDWRARAGGATAASPPRAEAGPATA